MKDFMLKHPFWSWMIIGRLCIMVEVLIRNNRPTVESTGDILNAAARYMKTVTSDKKKEPMGFHFAKEEA